MPIAAPLNSVGAKSTARAPFRQRSFWLSSSAVARPSRSEPPTAPTVKTAELRSTMRNVSSLNR